MVRQRFLVLFRRWAFTVAKVLGPVFLFEIFVLVRQHLNYAPVTILDLLAGAGPALFVLGLGRVVVVETAKAPRFCGRDSAMLPKLLEP